MSLVLRFFQRPLGVAMGTEAIHAALNPILDAGMQVNLNVTPTLVAGDIAVTYNEWTGAAKMSGGEELTMAGKAMEVRHCQPDGTWRFAIDEPYARG